MVFIGRATFSRQSAQAAVIPFVNLPPLPSFLEKRGPFFRLEDGGRIHALTLYEATTSDAEQVRRTLDERYAAFADVRDFEYTLEEWLEGKEAVQRLDVDQAP